MSSAGSAAGGGFDLQASTGSFVTAHILAREPLHWLPGDIEDVPTAISAESGGPGDDLRIEFEGGVVAEVEVKRGLRADARFWGAIEALTTGLAQNSTLFAILVVDSTATEAIRSRLRQDLVRLHRGRDDNLHEITLQVQDFVRRAGYPDEMLRRLAVHMLMVEDPAGPHTKDAVRCLAGALEDPTQALGVWDVLTRDVLNMIRIRGRRDRSSLISHLARRGHVVRQSGGILAASTASGIGEEGSSLTSTPVQSSPEAQSPEDAPWLPRFNEARELYRQGAVRSALAMWDRLRKEIIAAPASASLRARVHNNIAVAHLELARPDEARVTLQTALDYSPEDATILAHLAQAELLADRRADALRHARAAIDRDSESLLGWSILIQSAETPIEDEEIPTALRNVPEILVARAMEINRRDRGKAADLLREALRTGPRELQILIVLAETIYVSLYPRRASDPVPAAAVEEITRLGIEAATALEGTERVRLLARALVVQGAAADLAGDVERGAALFKRAAQVDPSYKRAQLAAARAQMILGNGPAALYLVEDTPEEERDAWWHSLRAASLLEAGRPEELDADVRAAVSIVEPENVAHIAQSLADTVFRAARFDLITLPLDLLERAGQQDWVHLFRARVAARTGDRDTAVEEYETALGIVPPQARSELEVEFAAYLNELGEHERAAELFEAANAWNHSERAAQRYAGSLFVLGWWDRAASSLEKLGGAGDLPSWALDLQSRIALYRDDVPGALAALEQLIQLHPDDADVRLRLAHTLLRVDADDQAAEVLASLEAREDLDPEDMVNLARLLVQVGRSRRAMILAYRALRERPDDPRIQVACITEVFLAADDVPGDLLARTAVVADTWVKLAADDGEEMEYLILSEGPTDIRRNELLATDDRAQQFLGLAKGDRVVLHRSTVNEKAFLVAELKSAILHTVHDAMLGYQARFPGRTDMQMLHVGQGESFDPWPFFKAILQKNEAGKAMVEWYREKRLPMGTMADVAGQSVRRTYLQFLRDPDTVVYVEEPSQDRLEESLSEARKEAVVVTATGLATLEVLDQLGLLPKLYHRLLVPQSLVDEFNVELAHWEAASRYGGYKSAGVNEDYSFGFTDISVEDLEQVSHHLTKLRDTVLEMAEVSPRPLAPRSSRDAEIRELVGESSADAAALAGPDVALHVDDWGLRWLARSEYHAAGFSTYALLRVAEERGLISADELRRCMVQLITFGHYVIPIDADLLFEALAERAYQIDATMLRLFDRLADPSVTLVGAAGVAVGLLRRLAISPLGKGSLSLVTTILLDRVTQARDLWDAVRLFLEQIGIALRLLPQEYDIVRERVSAFVAAKGTSLD